MPNTTVVRVDAQGKNNSADAHSLAHRSLRRLLDSFRDFDEHKAVGKCKHYVAQARCHAKHLVHCCMVCIWQAHHHSNTIPALASIPCTSPADDQFAMPNPTTMDEYKNAVAAAITLPNHESSSDGTCDSSRLMAPVGMVQTQGAYEWPLLRSCCTRCKEMAAVMVYATCGTDADWCWRANNSAYRSRCHV